MECIQLENYRYKKIEKFLKNGDLEIDYLQSFNPLMNLLKKNIKIAKSKWNNYKLDYNLIDIISNEPDNYIGNIIDLNNNIQTKNIFIKCTPILDPISICQKEYSNYNHHHWIPEINNFKSIRLYNKINDPFNTAYIDSFCSVILSKLTKISPHFASIYSVYTGIISEYEEDVTEDFNSLRNEKWFCKSILSGKYIIKKSPIEELRSSISKNKNIKRNISGTELCDLNKFAQKLDHKIIQHYEEEYKYTLIHPKIPVQIVFMEKFENTFEFLIKNLIERVEIKTKFNYLIQIRKNIVIQKLKSWIFQICAALSIANDKYNFVHNDLHVQNIMGAKTNKKFLYYTHNNTIYKIPTYGYIMKIIDFGRSTFTVDNTYYIGDVFSSDGEAGGQYLHPSIKDINLVNPNPAFDLSRFACSFIEDLEENKWPNVNDLEKYDIGKLINKWTFDDEGNSLMDIEGFDLYVSIAKYFRKQTPKLQIKENLFKSYIINNNNQNNENNIIIPN